MDNKGNLVAACERCNGNCMGCWESDYCNCYNDVAPYDVPLVPATASAAQ